ncbi:MAG: GspH/FimT family pseudopilin, partial [Gammaproteobacteria bacterium]|nr:GspH/FimT family pseudopilin [Gammaproteobacteria bacterium]
MKTRQTGFTLLELMLVVLLAGLLLSIGVPAMGNFIRNARLTGAANDVMVALHLTRSEAIKRRVPVTLCTSANPLVANPACTASTQLLGWIVFVDDNGDNVPDATDGNGVRDAGEAVLLLQHAALPNTITAQSTAIPLRVTYLNNGFASNAIAAQLVFCDERGNVNSGGQLSAARGITVSVTGRAGVTRDPAEIQVLIDAIGGPIAGCT